MRWPLAPAAWRSGETSGSRRSRRKWRRRWSRQFMAEMWRRVGLIVNPIAGSGARESLSAARTAIERLGAQEVSTGRGTTGETALSGWHGRVQVPNDNE